MGKTINRLTYTILDILIVAISFMIVAWIKPATIRVVLPQYALPFMIFVFTWLLFSSIGDKYRVIEEDNFISIVVRTLGINIFIVAFTLSLLLIFKVSFSRLIIFGTIIISTTLEIVFFFMFYYTQKFFIDNPSFAKTPMVMELNVPPSVNNEEVTNLSTKVYKKSRYLPKVETSISLKESILTPLLNNYLDSKEKVFEFVNANIVLEGINRNKSTIISTSTQYNIDHLERASQEIVINLHPMNDYRRINKFLISINKSMKIGSIFVGNAETLFQRQQRFLSKKYPRVIKSIFRILDFIINRAFPKMNATKGIYFAITKGRNRPLSKCEILGRLYFCGFEVIATDSIHNKIFFIMKKVKEPSEDVSPSYAPIFKMDRVGKHKKLIKVYKMRTMHPYAEYLQKYLIENFGYSKDGTGRPANDFRITNWGKFLRKYWLDELPQLINLVKGDLKLVGVRPISKMRFSEFPRDMQDLRTEDKPGCIPPYVALLMKDEKQNIEAERIYLKEKAKRPAWTDIKYFWLAIFNILSNRIRSE